MNVLQSIADEREASAIKHAEADDRWLRECKGIDDPEARRASFHRWVKNQLLKAFTWPEDAARREKLLGQCVSEITVMVRQLRGRGWLLDGEALATEVKDCITPIGTYQHTGKVGDFWPYFRAGVRRYVDANAERIQALARCTGTEEGAQAMGAVLAGLGLDRLGKTRAASMTELVADRAPKKKAGRPRTANKGDQTLPLL